MAGRTGVERAVFRHVVACSAAFQCNWWFGGSVTGVAPGHIMESVQQTGLGVALRSYAARCRADVVGVQDIVNGRCLFVGMAVQAARLQIIGDHLGHSPAGVIGRVDVTGRLVAGGTGTAVGRDVMQGLDVVKAVEGTMAEIAGGARRFLSQVGGRLDGNGMGDVTADSAMNVAIEIGRMAA